jgi:hypothetical protein
MERFELSDCEVLKESNGGHGLGLKGAFKHYQGEELNEWEKTNDMHFFFQALGSVE